MDFIDNEKIYKNLSIKEQLIPNKENIGMDLDFSFISTELHFYGEVITFRGNHSYPKYSTAEKFSFMYEGIKKMYSIRYICVFSEKKNHKVVLFSTERAIKIHITKKCKTCKKVLKWIHLKIKLN